jgi:hypothetical protein
MTQVRERACQEPAALGDANPTPSLHDEQAVLSPARGGYDVNRLAQAVDDDTHRDHPHVPRARRTLGCAGAAHNENRGEQHRHD